LEGFDPEAKVPLSLTWATTTTTTATTTTTLLLKEVEGAMAGVVFGLRKGLPLLLFGAAQ
jgi:hypothetical protein